MGSACGRGLLVGVACFVGLARRGRGLEGAWPGGGLKGGNGGEGEGETAGRTESRVGGGD